MSNTPSTTTFQGYQDVRTFSGFYNKLAAAFDPLGGKLEALTKNVNVQNLQNQHDINSVQHEIEMLKIQRELDALRSSTGSSNSTGNPPAPGGANSGSTSSSSNSGSSGPNVSPSPSTPISTSSAVPSPSEITTTQAKITSIEVLKDQIAWRNAVQAALRDQELDDAHDHAGLMLYTLKLDLSMINPTASKGFFTSNNERLAKVELTLPPLPKTFDCEAVADIYDSWFWHLRADMHKEAVSFQNRQRLSLLNEDETVRFAVASHFYTQRNIPLPLHPAVFISSKYEAALGDLVTIASAPVQIQINGQQYYVPNVQAAKELGGANYERTQLCKSTSMKTQFFDLFEKKLLSTQSVAPTVFVTEPKESAQNISDVAATEQLRNMILSLQAVLPQYGLNASNYTEYMTRSQKRLQGILRRPLVVAFSNGGKREFGWVLGPRYELGSNGEPHFNHTTAQHSVQVSIVVPGWLRHLSIGYTTSWVNNDGATVAAGNDGTLNLELPGDDTAITARLLSTTGTQRKPIIEVPLGNRLQAITVQEKQPADLVIRGQNLWRNPRVFIGSQAADLVQVLPDMNGLSAHFNTVVVPPHPGGQSINRDLSVVTSEGTAMLPQGIEVVP
jgi:hypothetical protein